MAPGLLNPPGTEVTQPCSSNKLLIMANWLYQEAFWFLVLLFLIPQAFGLYEEKGQNECVFYVSSAVVVRNFLC